MTATIGQDSESTFAEQPPLGAVSYLRVSTKEQAERDGDPEGYSIPAQREANRRKASSMGATIVEEFVDRGESARSADRPELQRLLGYVLANPEIKYVIVHKVDRLARNRMDDVTINLALKKAGVTLVSASENIDQTPSGMLLHGIMSSIAEFYSQNLATEVVKGMSQKAKTGGTPGKPPLGYRNVRAVNSDGREVRTIDLDPERCELVAWAFQAYATGDWTLTALAAELELRGLTNRPTPKFPIRPIRANHLHTILTHPYYKGQVVWQGAEYPGRHPRLVDDATWSHVQRVLEAHGPGEKQRVHNHYLKSSVFCGGCGSRLVITNSKNRYGDIYPYFICVGRHQRRTNCTRKALLISVVESLVEAFYTDVALDDDLRQQVETMLISELEADRTRVETEQHALTVQQQRLRNERAKLLQAHYAGAIPLDLLKTEQDRIGDQLDTVEARLAATQTHFDVVRDNLTTALDLASDCQRAYRQADSHTRRLLNQALFAKLYIDEEEASADPAEPYGTLLGADVMTAVGCGISQTDTQPTEAAHEPSRPCSPHTWTRSSIHRTRCPLTVSRQKTNKPAPTGQRGAGLKDITLVRPARFELATS
jgi:site-specific DNA recombinase